MTDLLNDTELEPPDRPDFRRVGKGTPFVIGPEGKRVRYGRPSNVGKILDDESNLTDWKLRTTVVGAAQRPDLMAKVSVLDAQTDKKFIRSIVEECLVSGRGKERAVKGEAVHSMFDHLDRHDDWQPAPQWVDLCNSYLATLDLWGLVPVDVEVHCINDAFRLAGSMDRRYRTTKLLVAPDGSSVPIGAVLAGDTKTGQVLEYASGSYATQLAAYAMSDRYNVETDEREAFDPPTFQDWGLIVHADSGRTEVQIFWVDLEAGYQGLKLAQMVKHWRQRADLLTLGAGPVMLAAVTAPDGRSEVAVEPQDGRRTLSLAEHTRDRIRALLAFSELAGKALQRQWPEGIAGLKAGGHSWDQLQQVITAVERVEAEYQVPFFPSWNDPTESKAVRDNHPSVTHAETRAKRSLKDKIAEHPRSALIQYWIAQGREGGIDKTIDTVPLCHALLDFASINTDGWNETVMPIDEQLSLFLEGTLRAIGYGRGLLDLGCFDPSKVSLIMSAAFSVTAGTAMLLYGEDGKCILRTNIVRGTE